MGVYSIVFVSFLANFLNYFDRFLVAVVLEDIKADFNINDSQAGLLVATFTIGYLVASPFIGYLADKKSRTKIFGICVIIWSVATIACAMVKNFHLLLLARTAIGIGEAGCLVIAPALLSDRFPENIRGRILSFFYVGFPLGATCAFIIGGIISKHYGWEAVFYVAGLPGILVGAILIAFQDVRGSLAQKQTDSGGFMTYMGFLKNPVFLIISFSQSILAFAFVPLLHWGIGYFETEKSFQREFITSIFGAAALAAGIIGNTMGGFIGDRLNKSIKGGYILVCSIALIFGFPFLWTSIMAKNHFVIGFSIFFGFLAFYTFLPCINAQLASIVPSSQRAMAFALSLFLIHILGDTISPIMFGSLVQQYGERYVFEGFILFIPISAILCFVGFLIIKKKFSSQEAQNNR